jgi:hypothetical protein
MAKFGKPAPGDIIDIPRRPAPPAAPLLPPELPPAPAGETLKPLPVAEPHGPVPRVIQAFERVHPDSDLTRYKVGCRNYSPQPDLYVLAKDQESAVSHYLEHTFVAETIRQLETQGNKPEKPAIVVKVLPD